MKRHERDPVADRGQALRIGEEESGETLQFGALLATDLRVVAHRRRDERMQQLAARHLRLPLYGILRQKHDAREHAVDSARDFIPDQWTGPPSSGKVQMAGCGMEMSRHC